MRQSDQEDVTPQAESPPMKYKLFIEPTRETTRHEHEEMNLSYNNRQHPEQSETKSSDNSSIQNSQSDSAGNSDSELQSRTVL